MTTATQITKAHYNAVAGQLNRIMRTRFTDSTLQPRVSVLERGTDGLIILMNDDAHDLADRSGYVQDLFHTGEVFVVGDHDFYLEAYDSDMAFKLAE